MQMSSSKVSLSVATELAKVVAPNANVSIQGITISGDWISQGGGIKCKCPGDSHMFREGPKALKFV